ncbi:unnamed protein product, partial [Allacma fusca]
GHPIVLLIYCLFSGYLVGAPIKVYLKNLRLGPPVGLTVL